MKKYFALVLTLVMVLGLAACGNKELYDDPHALETADTFYAVGDNGVSVDITEDTAKIMLGVFTPAQLGLKNTIDKYDLVLSATAFEGKNGCKIEAFADGEKEAEGTFMIVGTQCFVFDSLAKKYVPLSADNTKTTVAGSTSPANTIPDDPEITFQYHKENNYLMQQRFSQYDYEALGLSKEVSEYVFIVNGNSGFALDGVKIYYVDVHEKNGDFTGVSLGFSEDAEYIYKDEYSIYAKIEKES